MSSLDGVNLCPEPFFDAKLFDDGGFVEGRLCQQTGELSCCLPCPLTHWVYPDYFETVTDVANWVATVSAICCVFLILSWTVLPVNKTNRHYLSICLTIGIFIMSLGFVIPLAAQPDQCFNRITPNSMHTSSVCGASGSMLMLGGWSAVMWAFLRSLHLHLQICWQMLVGRPFMIFAQVAGWGVPLLALALGLIFSGVSFRFGQTCHIVHKNSLADFWVPLLVFAGATVVITFATFGYCIKVYLASLSDTSGSSEGSSLPAYSTTASHQNISPRQAYRRIRRVISLQWRGIAIVLIIITDVIFFSVVFVFQDNVMQSVTNDPTKAAEWSKCLIQYSGNKEKCLGEASSLVVNDATVTAVLFLLALNGIWILFLMGRWTMVTGWLDMLHCTGRRRNPEFISADARAEPAAKDTRSYEMLSKDTSVEVTPLDPVMRSPSPVWRDYSANAYNTTAPVPTATAATSESADGRHTPDYFGHSARYHAPTQSFSTPRQPSSPPRRESWDPQRTYAQPQKAYHGRQQSQASNYEDMTMNPLGMNRI
ncbi:7 transmembrane receptor (Secretin family) [Geosmithia morbida]|uniref:7 transmembrane receptor (Secretin family) n=1 Tax=Geosmithia morbida TaxID=1094350 RepID=A0A9P5D5N3_9HYPO|nr:7 transmembrane receptor (Secretin family) [Geosmithia morbida]KAF4123965.1 7 transmembrane receptor (Secretin family) [Geosmithia morbida]